VKRLAQINNIWK